MKEKYNHRYWSCEKKIPYPNWLTAEKDALRIMDEGRRELIMAYKCQYVDEWHLGHNPRVTQALFNSSQRGEVARKGTEFDKLLKPDTKNRFNT